MKNWESDSTAKTFRGPMARGMSIRTLQSQKQRNKLLYPLPLPTEKEAQCYESLFSSAENIEWECCAGPDAGWYGRLPVWMRPGTGGALASDSMLQCKYFCRSDDPAYYIVLEISVVKNTKCGYYGRRQWKNHRPLGFWSKAMSSLPENYICFKNSCWHAAGPWLSLIGYK